MNSSTVISTSSMPLWVPSEKCFPKVFSWFSLVMSPKCPTNLSFMRTRVCPMYCLSQKKKKKKKLKKIFILILLN